MQLNAKYGRRKNGSAFSANIVIEYQIEHVIFFSGSYIVATENICEV